MNVALLSFTPEPEKLVAASAKLCYSQSGVEDIKGKLSDEQSTKFLDMLMSFGHASPIEHVNFTFGIEGISRACTHQLVRHRIASYSQQSQRYVKLSQFEYIVPPAIENNKVAKAIFEKAMAEDQEHYNALVESLVPSHKETFLQEGLSEKKATQMAEKKAIEDARFVFPNACETKIVVTMNARTLLHFFEHRCCERAQWEIREMATQMVNLVQEVAPTLFKHAGPSCVNGPCPEGTMTCGKMKEKRELFLK